MFSLILNANEIRIVIEMYDFDIISKGIPFLIKLTSAVMCTTFSFDFFFGHCFQFSCDKLLPLSSLKLLGIIAVSETTLLNCLDKICNLSEKWFA